MLRHRVLTVTRIEQFVNRLRDRMYHAERVPLQLEVAGPVGRISYDEAQKLKYKPVQLGFVLEPVWATFWFRVKLEIPKSWAGRQVDLLWNTHSEGLVWRDGVPFQGVNYEPYMAVHGALRPDAKLTDSAKGGEKIALEIEVACNTPFGASSGKIDKYPTLSQFVLDQAELASVNREAREFYYDMLVPAQLLIINFRENEKLDPWTGHLFKVLNEICNIVDLDKPVTWTAARKMISELYAHKNATYWHELSAIGHAHIDTAWLWPLAESHRKCLRTFSTAVNYMQEYPEYRFSCSQAQQYDWVKTDSPDLYRRIKAAAKKGQWVPVGGTWIEPDCNVPSGESLVRQFLYGQRFFKSEFGRYCTEFWNPDVFGYSGALPQIMRGAGIKYFLTQKLSWNQFNKPMHQVFHWEGIDGSKVLTHFPPANTYNAMDTPLVVDFLLSSSKRFADPEHVNESYILYGHGDGGGGPTRNMLEVLRRCKDFLGIPRTQQRSSAEFFARLESEATAVPTVVGELYFELHRATYTTQAANKRNNRYAEHLLRNVEFLSQVNAVRNRAKYPAEEIERIWKLALLHQFHDILPGSSIGEVYRESDRDYSDLFQSGGQILDAALSSLDKAAEPVAVNSCGWQRSEIAELAPSKNVKLPEPAQKSYRGQGLYALQVPSMGYAPVKKSAPESKVTASRNGTRYVLENAQLSAEFSSQGTLVRLSSPVLGRDFLLSERPGNQFVLFDDNPVDWDAWDVDVFHLEARQELPPATEVRIIEKGPLRAGLELRWSFGKSTLIQRAFLRADGAALEFECELDWHERHKFLKVEFPVNIHATEATYEIQYGLVKRPTHFNTMQDIARFEVSGHRWIDFSENSSGVALFTDCKYGYAVHENMMRISLVRAPVVPDPEADQGKHAFRFAIYPHAGDYRQGEVLRRAHEFNNPLLLGSGGGEAQSLFSVDSGDLVIDCVKAAEDGAGTVVRLYEAHGTRGKAELRSALPFKKATAVNLLEEKQHALASKAGVIELEYKPFELITVLLT